MSTNLDEQIYEGLYETALEISRERRETLSHIKQALLEGDDEQALEIMRDYCGIENEESN